MKDINIDTLLEATIKSQMEGKKEIIPTEFEKGTKLLIVGTGDKHLKKYIGDICYSLGIQQNYNKYIKKTKVLLNDGETAYFKNNYLIKSNNNKI